MQKRLLMWKSMAGNEHLQELRKSELEAVSSLFRPGLRVLEVGGGSGYQASLIASCGCHVTSVDVAGSSAHAPIHFTVHRYDGMRLPFGDQSFDVVFSSNVLEHIANLPEVLRETRRVVKNGGLHVHIVPSSAWRCWTIVSHYPYLLKRILGGSKTDGGHRQPGLFALAGKKGWGYMMKRLLVSGSHGETASNAFAEIYHFKRENWKALFEAHGFTAIDIRPSPLFYTGYEIFPKMPLKIRRILSRVLGSACHVFVLR